MKKLPSTKASRKTPTAASTGRTRRATKARAKTTASAGGRAPRQSPRTKGGAAPTTGPDVFQRLAAIEASLDRILHAVELLAGTRLPVAAQRGRGLQAPARHAAGAVARGLPSPPLARAMPASAAALGERLAELQASIDALLATASRLERVPPAEVAQLDLDARRRRAHALSDAFLAIEELENAKLGALNDAFESRREELHAATRRLADAQVRIEGTVAFIDAAASAIGIVANVVSLLR